MNQQPVGVLVSGWQRAGVILIYTIGLVFGVSVLMELLVLRGCGVTHTCGPAQDAFTLVALLIVLAGSVVLGILGWTGRLPRTRVATPDAIGRLQHSSVAAVVALTIASAGLYIPIWLMRRREALNLLNSRAKLWVWGPPALLAAQATFLSLPQDGVGFNVARLCTGIIVLVLSFRVRSILGDHVNSNMTSGFLTSRSDGTPSAMLTFLLNIWYLQYEINEVVAERDAVPPPEQTTSMDDVRTASSA